MENETTPNTNDTSNPIPNEPLPQATPPVSTDPLQALRDAADRQADTILADDATVNPEIRPAPVEPTDPEQSQTTEPPLTPVQPVAQPATPTTEPETNSEADDELFPAPQPQQVPETGQVQAKDFIDANGYFDAEAFSKAVNENMAKVTNAAAARAANEYQAQRNEERLWDKAVVDYPELKTNKTLRDIVQNARIGKMTELYQQAGADPAKLSQIKAPSPSEIAKSLFALQSAAKEEGQISATQSIEVQNSAQAPASGTVEPAPNVNEELFGKIGDAKDPIGAQKAQRDLLKNMLFGSQ